MDLLQDDRALLDAFRRGDEPALQQVYFAYAESLFSYLRRGFPFSSGGRHFAFIGYTATWQLEDAMQDVFLRAFRKEARLAYDGLRPFKSYLFTIARNRVMDLFRQNHSRYLDVREIEQIDEVEFRLNDEDASPEQVSVDQELKEHVIRFVGSLSAALTELFKLRFVEGKSLEDVCRQTGLTDYRAKQYEKRIKEQFFRYMQEQGYFRGYSYSVNGVERLIVTIFMTLMRG